MTTPPLDVVRWQYGAKDDGLSAGLYLLQTLLGVSVLGYTGQLVEIEAVALAGQEDPVPD
jgi:hypothetical protein